MRLECLGRVFCIFRAARKTSDTESIENKCGSRNNYPKTGIKCGILIVSEFGLNKVAMPFLHHPGPSIKMTLQTSFILKRRADVFNCHTDPKPSSI